MRDEGSSGFLRSPSFPGIDASVAAVSGEAGRPPTGAEARAAVERLRVQRVGGRFWGRRIEARGRVVRAELPEDADPWLGLAGSDSLVAQPNDEWALVAALLGITVEGVEDHHLLDELVRGLHATRYRDPFTDTATTVDQTIDLLSLWRDRFDENRDTAAILGIRGWKRAAMRGLFFDGMRSPPAVSRLPDVAEKGRRVAMWPSRVTDADVAAAMAAGFAIDRIEDGFVRSAGLGSDLTAPSSIVVDRQGIHYDPNGPSGLEQLLEHGVFGPALIARTQALVTRMVEADIGKYGAQVGEGNAFAGTEHRLRLLVIGQVDDDESVRLGGTLEVPDNRALLSRVRRDYPDAWIVYRPHPDVTAGHRRGAVDDAVSSGCADMVEPSGNLFILMRQANEVHVLTSLAGFEALLRDRPVVVHGRPFYAGWGLTDDRGGPFERRTRRLSIVELAAAALIVYPRYIDPVTRLPCPVEVVVDRLAAQPAAPTLLTRLRRLQGRARVTLAAVA